MRLTFRALAPVFFAAGLAVPRPGLAASSTSDLWIHVAVHDQGETKVHLTLPLGLVEGLLPLLEGDHDGKLRITASDMDDIDLKELWAAAHSVPEGEWVPVRAKHSHEEIQVARKDGQLVIRAKDHDDSQVRVRIPLSVAERLVALSEQGTTEVHLDKVMKALRNFGAGELVTAEDGKSSVRVWIDHETDSD
jgi:hypothetical protein